MQLALYCRCSVLTFAAMLLISPCYGQNSGTPAPMTVAPAGAPTPPPAPAAGSVPAPTGHIGANTPSVSDFYPNSVEQGKPVTMAVTGSNFQPGCKVLWNGSEVPTAYINSGKVLAMFTPDSSGPFTIQVENPGYTIPGSPGTAAAGNVPAVPPTPPQTVPAAPSTEPKTGSASPSQPTAYSISIGYRRKQYSTLLGAVGTIGNTKVIVQDHNKDPQVTWGLGGLIAGGTQSGTNSGKGTAGFGLGPRFLFGTNRTFTIMIGGYLPVISGGAASGGIGNPELLGSLSFQLTPD